MIGNGLHLKHYYSKDKALLKFIYEPFGHLADNLDVVGLSEHLLDTTESSTRGTAYYSKVLQGELTPQELAELLTQYAK